MTLTAAQKALKQRFVDARGQWTEEWESILTLNAEYFEAYLRLQDTAQSRQRLPPKVQEYIYIAVAACSTHIHAPAIRAHIQSAISLGATAEEITEVLGLTYLVGIHTVTLGAPLLLELIDELGISKETLQSPKLDQKRLQIKEDFIRRRGFWTDTWNPLLELDPIFFESYADFSALATRGTTLDPKYREIIICAFDAATTHLYGRGTRIHMRNALNLGATVEELMEMLEITSLMGIDGVTTGLGLLRESTGSASHN
ncbi:carboxymuconolactone decarboxylase [Aspergillus sergii]|uniref:Carboxymuconolactone decarboxylase n=1 Tax=Aspergillus sergii TaxID=1034303 RepID=A0A5N6XDW6_9EURO|nr:carboxymuconolactone decarboxylase [Aspergillus sergii]